MMDSTIEFLWKRKQTGGVPGDAQAWAISLLESGVESHAIVRLAGQRELHWQEEAALMSQALRDIGKSSLESHLTLMRAFEQASVADYLAGKIDGWTLLHRGCDLDADAREDQNEFLPWVGLADEADQYGQGLGGPHGFDRRPFDEALKSALKQWGRFPIAD